MQFARLPSFFYIRRPFRHGKLMGLLLSNCTPTSTEEVITANQPTATPHLLLTEPIIPLPTNTPPLTPPNTPRPTTTPTLTSSPTNTPRPTIVEPRWSVKLRNDGRKINFVGSMRAITIIGTSGIADKKLTAFLPLL